MALMLALIPHIYGVTGKTPAASQAEPREADGQANSSEKDKQKTDKKKSILPIDKNKIIPKYKEKENQKHERTGLLGGGEQADASALRKSAGDDISSVMLLLAEIPERGRSPIIAPIFMMNKEKIFDSGTDVNFEWLGYKVKSVFKQKKFPFANTELQETLIGSFVNASGTNLGFIDNSYRSEKRFYTNYTSQILTFKWGILKYLKTGFSLDSRQYFFVEREADKNFIMPRDHVNIFPNLIIESGATSEKGIDQIMKGIKLSLWSGYGYRSDWAAWGDPADTQSGDYAKDFWIYSSEINAGFIPLKNHNLVCKIKYKGGIDNDFISRPRFGGTIDNIRLDLVHGFSLDEFRVFSFGLMNFKYGLDIMNRVRLNLYADFARITSPGSMNITGSAYGLRIKTIGGMPLWITHGIGKIIGADDIRQTLVIMAAAGW